MFTGQHYGRAWRVNQGKVVSVCQKGIRKRIATDKALLGKNLIVCGAYWRIERQHANQTLAAKTQGNETSERHADDDELFEVRKSSLIVANKRFNGRPDTLRIDK